MILLNLLFALSCVLGDKIPGSDWYPRKSIQWPRPASGYVARNDNTRLCLGNSVTSEVTISGSQFTLAQANAILDKAMTELNVELATSGGRQNDCLRPAADVNPAGTLITTLRIDITGALGEGSDDLGPYVNESYTLTVNSNGADIAAATVFGARHGIMTLANMIEVRNFAPPGPNYYANRIPQGNNWHFILPYADFTIVDRPRLAHRGVMIDTSRHYQEWDDLYKVVDGLSRSKMNVLHWHATDDQSFPLVMSSSKLIIHGPDCAKNNPQGHCYGAYNPHMTYHEEDIIAFVQYAYERGVRVVVEIDQPSHARSWANRDTSLRECSELEHQEDGYCLQPICGPLALVANPTGVRALADLIIEDWLRITRPGETLHLGMDEIGARCWGDYLRDQVSAAWLAASVDSIDRLGTAAGESEVRRIIVWQDGLEYYSNNVSVPVQAAGVIAQVWDSPGMATDLLEKGRDIVWSPAASMYLDCGRGSTAVPTFPSWCDPYKTWWHIYRETPDLSIPYNREMEGVGRILGGEVPMWAEQTDTSNLHTLLWPRVAAWGGAAWEARSEPVEDPTTVEAAAPILRAQHELAALSNTMAQLKGIRHTPMFVQWCIYEDERMCDRFTDSFYTPSPPREEGAIAKLAGSLFVVITGASLLLI